MKKEKNSDMFFNGLKEFADYSIYVTKNTVKGVIFGVILILLMVAISFAVGGCSSNYIPIVTGSASQGDIYYVHMTSNYTKNNGTGLLNVYLDQGNKTFIYLIGDGSI
jgi:hypothetical protein